MILPVLQPNMLIDRYLFYYLHKVLCIKSIYCHRIKYWCSKFISPDFYNFLQFYIVYFSGKVEE